MAINDYLQVIAAQRDLLKNNLIEKNVSVDGCSTFNQLTPKVLEIITDSKTGAQNGVWTPTLTAESFTVTGLDFIPAKLAICCEDILTKTLTSVTDHINIAILNIELTAKEISMIENSAETGVTLNPDETNVDIVITEQDGIYSVTVDFSTLNETLEIPYKFKANASHLWCVAQEGWLI